ncbi:hypothetical protein EV715DRAFT_250441 [Schizophyllum commune]
MSSGREARTAKRQSVPNPFPASQRTTKASTSASAGVKRRREFSPMSVSSGITLASGASSLTNDASSSTGDASTLSPLSSPSSSKCSSPAPQTACGRSKHATRKEVILNTPLPSYFQVDDLKLKPKREFNLLWYWLAERQDIYDRRRQGLPRDQWTDDPLLQHGWFCNAYRILDRECQFLVREVIEKGSQEPAEICFRVLLYDIFTRSSTYQLLAEHFAPLSYKTFDPVTFADYLRGHEGLYTRAFQKTSAPDKSRPHLPRLDAHLEELEKWIKDDVLHRIANREKVTDVFDYFFGQPGWAEFKAYQLTLNLSYTPLVNFHANDLVVPGPGARAGLKRMFGASMDAAVRDDPRAYMRALLWMTRTQDEHFQRLGLRFARLEGRPLEAADIEHAVCELEKYARNGSRIRPYKPASDHPPPLPPPVLPKAWGHPARAKPNPSWPDTSKDNKGYFIEAIVDDKVEDGEQWVYIKWLNYSTKDNTWEPAWSIWHDAPLAMEEYFGHKAPAPKAKSRKRRRRFY